MTSGPPEDHTQNLDDYISYDQKEIGKKLIDEAFEQATTGYDQ